MLAINECRTLTSAEHARWLKLGQLRWSCTDAEADGAHDQPGVDTAYAMCCDVCDLLHTATMHHMLILLQYGLGVCLLPFTLSSLCTYAYTDQSRVWRR